MNLERRETEDCLELREPPEEKETLASVVPLDLWALLVLLESPDHKDRRVLRDHWVLQVRREIQELWDHPDHLGLRLM